MKHVLPIVLLLALAGCADKRPMAACLAAGGGFHAIQLGVEGAMYSDALSSKQEASAKKISAGGTEQLQECRDAAATSDGNAAIFATGYLRQATLSLSAMLLPDGAHVPDLPDFGPEGAQ